MSPTATFTSQNILYSWKTLLKCDKTWPAVKRALRSNVDIALTLFRNGAWGAS